MSLLAALAGVALLLFVCIDAFEAMVLPRRVDRRYRFARLYTRAAWWVWGALAALAPRRRRETFLSGFGPLSLLGLFGLWAAGLAFGFALLHWAVGPLSFADALYFSGVTFTTLGYGDVTPAGPLARFVAVVEAATGFGYFALVIGYLPTLYQSFSRRERLIALLDARAGSPPSAGRLLLRLSTGRDGEALERFLLEAESWAAELLESHLSFPLLTFYRSQHGNQSWLAALACVLDTSSLLLTVVEGADRQQARLTFAMARHALVDLAQVFSRPKELPKGDERLPDDRLRELCAALRESGAAVRDDEATVAKLRELRGLYEPFVVVLAGSLRVNVPPVWPEGDRPDNWQTSAWMPRAGHITSLGIDHFD